MEKLIEFSPALELQHRYHQYGYSAMPDFGIYWRPSALPYHLEFTVENLSQKWEHNVLASVKQCDIRKHPVRPPQTL